MTHIHNTHELIKVVCERLDTPYCNLRFNSCSDEISRENTYIEAWDYGKRCVTDEEYGNEVIDLYDAGDKGVRINYEVHVDGFLGGWVSTWAIVDDIELVSKFRKLSHELWNAAVESNERQNSTRASWEGRRLNSTRKEQTMKNIKIIKQFAKNATNAEVVSVEYIYGEYAKSSTGHSYIQSNHHGNLVYQNKKNHQFESPIGDYWFAQRKRDTLFIRFDLSFVNHEDIDENITIDLETGYGFYHRYDGRTCENTSIDLGKLTKEELKPLVAFYNKHYLDRYAEDFADEDCMRIRNFDAGEDHIFLGIHNDFLRLAQNIYNPVLSINKPAKDEFDKFVVVPAGEDDFEFDKRLRFVKTQHVDGENETIIFA